jgi:NADH-ubiquinone oxidoreductase chain 2
MLVLALFVILAAVALPSVHATPTILTRITSITFVVAGILAINVIDFNGLEGGLSLYNGIINVDITSLGASILMLIIGGIALIPWSTHDVNGPTSQPSIATYPLFALFSLIGGCLLVSIGDLITLYLALELQSFSLYIIASVYRDNESATHSGLLYFLLGGLSSCFILLGSALIYNQFGVISIDSIISLMQVENINEMPWSVYFAWATIATGFLFKVTAAPYHNWGPDVYDGVPTIITTWLSVLPKISLLMVLMIITLGMDNNILNITVNNNVFPVWSTLLLISSVLSLIVGTIVGLAQTRVKRLLAYSTISHIGFMLLALAVHSESGIESFLFYILQYTLTSITTFMIVLSMGYNRDGKDVGFIAEMKGIFQSQPVIGISFAICLFSMAGVPPLIGFFGKQFVLFASIDAGYTFISLLAIVVSVISASYYLYLVRVIHFDSSDNKLTNVNTVGTTNVHSYIMSVFILSISLFIVNPSIVLDSISLMAMSLYST